MRVGINGFGRIGRLVLRAALKRDEAIEFAAVNDITDAATLAHLLTYDSVHGVWPERFTSRDGVLCVGRRTIRVLSEANPAKLPWKDLGVDVVLECTGKFTERDKAAVHLGAGAKRVLVSAPAKGADATFVIGVNEETFDPGKHQVVSIASCTTNCLAPVLWVLDQTFGIERGLMTTVHAYTNDQRLQDSPHKDLRRARAAAVSLIPTSTGAAKAIGHVIPSLQGKMDGLSVRVPIADGSLIDVTVATAKAASVASVNAAMKAAAEGKLRGILQYTEDPIVSQDVVGNPHSAVFDSQLTMLSGDRMVKVFAWYDNEWGFSNRMVDTLLLLGRGC
ncbi:MAG: type I glyceraldehyde-3-phosphate dehydrogenase [Candidatus Eisenbacteria bacterium]|uniref:Glyceraldehyde-3-phosphate dehydrogenase n=1 Tax=Eiseniibacteriota bacterium TaxID=2212470 RepID=A0A538T5P7_UNCEI|nr:MAG: type I glyceraldehyde-3-phosphate dehydrogenase [Candidatus Eisenbacteria bacterium]